MGLFDKINEKVMGGASKLIKNKIESTIKKLVKEKRLAFLNAEEVDFTDKTGNIRELNLDEMAGILVEASGAENLLSVGITPDVVRNMLVEEWNKQRGGK